MRGRDLQLARTTTTTNTYSFEHWDNVAALCVAGFYLLRRREAVTERWFEFLCNALKLHKFRPKNGEITAFRIPPISFRLEGYTKGSLWQRL